MRIYFKAINTASELQQLAEALKIVGGSDMLHWIFSCVMFHLIPSATF